MPENLKRYRVIGEWIIEAASPEDAENLVDNAVSGLADCIEMDNVTAELEDGE